MSGRALAALLAVVAVLLAAACGTAPAPAPAKAELVWATGRISVPAAEHVAARWHAAHPDGPTVRVEALPESADDQRQLLALELNAGIPEFDVVDLDVVWTAEFAGRGWLTDLSALRPEVAATALPAAVDSATWDGRLWAAPFTTDAGLLYYRTDLVGDRPPTRWDELVAVGTRVREERGIAPFVVDGAAAEGLVVGFLEYLWGDGGEFAVDGDRVRLDEPEATRAVEFIRAGHAPGGFFAPGTADMQLEEAAATFRDGGAVFLRSWPYAYRELNDPASPVAGRVGVAPLPTFDVDGTVAALGGHNLAVSRFSGAPDAAREFVRFATTDRAVQRALATEFSLAPAASSVYPELAGDPVMDVLRTVLPKARTRPVTPVWAEISEEVQEQVVAGTLGRTRPADAVATLRRLVEATVRT